MNTAIIITFDQLSAHFLGPYGNTMVETPQFKRLAAQSLLFDFAFTDAFQLNSWFDRIWSLDGDAGQTTLADLVGDMGCESVLITDDPQVAAHPLAKFDQVILIDQPEVIIAANDLSDTQLANFFAQAIAWLDRDFSDGQICWLHSRGLAGAWDAPQDWRAYFAAEDDPDPPRFVNPPAGEWTAGEVDLDQILGWQQAAAAQVQVLDQCLGILLDQLQELAPRWAPGELLLGVAGCRGFALGEHQRLGADQRFYNENIQVPLMFSILSAAKSLNCIDKSENESQSEIVESGSHTTLADCDIFPGRSMAMVKTSLLSVVLYRWLAMGRYPSADTNPNDDFWLALDCPTPDYQHDFIYLSDADTEMLQTHAWKIICTSQGQVELFAKPEDRWEVNEVSDRCPEIVEELKMLIEQIGPRIQENGIPCGGPTQPKTRLILPLNLGQRMD